ncbi:LAME_0F03400g1_1 [Lachancea meyersii CBS 8951]|uniref:LAME_0F03400g1_1 n=1 Tax=Lachancea meyersii CBS 8951 TaxID=1266667 RepID=A0A1G4JR84_9SACH|nr:LAME_0F03400g1_1 [Lachancea meyersii CBS 8951]
MAKKKASKSFRNVKQNSNEFQSMDPLFGQNRAFALEGNLVNPEVKKYLQAVRIQALSTLGANPSERVSVISTRNGNKSLYDEEPLINQSLARFDKSCSAWLGWFREMKREIDGFESFPSQEITPQTLDLLLFYFKSFLQEAVSKDGISADENVTRVLELLQTHNVDVGSEDQVLEIDEEWACNLMSQLKTKRSNKIQNLNDLRHLIKTPAPLPQNFNSWHNFITKTQPTSVLLQRMKGEGEVLRLASYLIQWLGDISKNKNVEKVSQWTLFVLLYLEKHVPAQDVSILRDLGKKARQCKLKGLTSPSNSSNYYLQVPRGLLEPHIKIEPLTAIDLVLTVVAFEYGQRDLVDWTGI